jgi:acetyltransferase-like isoleucine patch superfamily enzyme
MVTRNRAGNFLSSKAILGKDVRLEGFNSVLGKSEIGSNCLVGFGTIIGYPARDNMKKLLRNANASLESFDISYYDRVSSGSKIGFNCVIRGRAYIYESSFLGNNVETGHNIMIRENARIGNETRIGTNTVLDSGLETNSVGIVIGDRVSIQTGVYIPAPIIIGNGVFIGPNVVFTNDRYPPSPERSQIIVKDEAAIGANSTVIAGVEVGANSMVAAGSVVTRDVPENDVVKGNPAKHYMTIDEYRKRRVEYSRPRAAV